MIQEYYLHLLGGINGENDQYSGAGRIITAALMAGYGLNASNKKDLQNRINWQATPGCFLGQKEIDAGGWATRNNPELKFLTLLLAMRKVNRTMNYILDWSVIDNEQFSFDCCSSIWEAISKIYWSGYFLFGRNVIPVDVMGKLRRKFTTELPASQNERGSLNCHHLMQFFATNGFLTTPISAPNDHLFRGEATGTIQRHFLFASLVSSINFQDNIPGFYAMAAMLPILMRRDQSFGDMTRPLEVFVKGRVGKAMGYAVPLTAGYYYPTGMGRPSIPTGNSFPNTGREIIPLLFCRLDRTPQEEAASSYNQVFGQFNEEFVERNKYVYVTACMLYEFTLLLTGRELMPLARLKAIREGKNWSEEDLMAMAPGVGPMGGKNCTLYQIVHFNLERQNQV